ncbi:MAG: TIGR02281 family clan AA aspartic protease [Deltaproteobacteria bacterium]|nr:MAG: TIGR02281 family clan AA aspartic protease [Deltaproteobacteria bacterium]TMA53664.1 MAG: TIGR02281 family clan AA aspartic protease [Deltaproteobacteria bacterium]TMA73559.1 MAG: TIGR02281 family clan AA aspartic protease [Deltaproteobacteria bacterium]TMB22815.1 MAG: TIGR02281 family clan AA aspartic protease [Deltaproteobacteria bacterium]
MRGRIVLLALVALLVAMPLAADWAGGLQREVPLDGNGNTWLVHATVNGSMNGLFLLDTGASYCVLAPTAARRLGVKASGENVEIRTANGVVRAPVIELATVDVGGNRARQVRAIVHPAVAPPLDGIIGLSFLNHFSYGVDPRRRVLRLN